MKKNESRWHSFMWYVTVIKGFHGIESYRQLSRFQNHRHNPKFYVELTVFDQLYNLRQEYDRLCKEKNTVSNLDAARAYFDSIFVNRTLTMLASTAIRLPITVIKELGVIMNDETPAICVNDPALNSSGAVSEDQMLERDDCRVYRSFVRLNSLYCSRNFMNPDPKFGDDVQINALHRIKELYILNGSRTVQHQTVTEQYKLSLDALCEEQKFLKYLNAETWPAGTENVRQNLLRSTVMDDELISNRGNDTVILETLRNTLIRMDRDLVCRLDITWNSSVQTEQHPPSGDDQHPNNNDLNENNLSNSPKTQNADENGPNPSMSLQQSKERMEQMKLQRDLDRLQSRGVESHKMSWQEYLKTKWNDGNERVDLIITEPPKAPSRSNFQSSTGQRDVDEISLEEVSSFPSEIKRILKPDGYAILILPFHSYMEWHTSFCNSGYDVIPSPYILAYNSETIPKKKVSVFPQCSYILGLIACLLYTSDAADD